MVKNKNRRAPSAHMRKVPEVPQQWEPTESRHFIVRSISWWDMSPTDAAFILEQSKDLQHRPIDIRYVRQYAEDMKMGRWASDESSTIVVDDEFRCWDGRTRLAAIIEAGKTIKMAVESVPKGTSGIDYLKTRNIGRPLRYADLLRLQGEKYCQAIATVLRILYDYELNGDILRGSGSYRMSNGAGEDLLRKHSGVRDSVAYSAGKISKILSFATSLAFCHYIIGKLNTKKRDEFFDTLCEGINLSERHPILHLRNRFLKERRDTTKRIEQVEACALIIKCWNAWIADERISLLVWKLNEPFPVLRKPGANVNGRSK